MAKDTYAAVTALSLFNALKRVAASFLSGKNNDASDYSIPVEIIAGGSGGGALESGGNLDTLVTQTALTALESGGNLDTLVTQSALQALEAGGNLAGAATSLAIMDDWDEADRAKVNLIVGQAGIAAGAGAVGATVPRMTLASDDPAVAHLANIKNALAPTTLLGVAGARFTSADQSAAAAAITDAPTGGQKIVLENILISVEDAQTITLSEETSGTVLATLFMAADTHFHYNPTRLKLATADKKIMIQSSQAGNIAATPLYHSEA